MKHKRKGVARKSCLIFSTFLEKEHKTQFYIPLNPVFKRLSGDGLQFMDEPTNGLDPVGIHEIRTLIRSLPERFDCTVFVSSHLLSEIELMADDIGILNHGHLLFEGTLQELRQNAKAKGYPTDNLEDTFLALIEEDNLRRGGAR